MRRLKPLASPNGKRDDVVRDQSQRGSSKTLTRERG